jgi:DNA repair protein RecO (recombination protein O)
MAILKTDAIVINKRDFRETSLLADFYTRDHGKIRGILKGIRKDPRKFASTVEPFSRNEIVFYKSRTSTLHLVSQCDVKENFNAIRQDLNRSAAGSMVMELLDAVMPQEDRNEEVFDLTVSVLERMAATSAAEKLLIIFKIKMLALSGFKPNFDSCVSCDSRIGGGEIRFSLSLGGLLCSNCPRKDPKSRAIFRGTVASIQYIQKNDLQNTLGLGLNPQIKKELCFILDSFIAFHLGKQMKSQAVMEQLQAPAAAAAI